jgi:UDP-2-acetamido-3-amino-2,3-dideoxy-glucuronate N-acetyltransferase
VHEVGGFEMKSSVIGLGEVGGGLFAILKNHYDIQWFEKHSDPCYSSEIMHVCIPWSDNFIAIVDGYVRQQNPTFVVVHSSVPVGTCQRLQELTSVGVFHSPIRGQHPDMSGGILNYIKYIGTDTRDAVINEQICSYFEKAGIRTKLMSSTRASELAKLLELCRYGTYIAFAKEQEDICKRFGVKYDEVVREYESTRSDGLISINRQDLCQPLLYPFKDYVGGHCTVEDMEILLEQIDTPLLRKAYEIDKNTKVWGNCNIYKSAKIGKGCSIGNGCEIGNKVVIGNNVRIGAMCFLPEGVVIEDNCFIAPRVSVSNDKYPPSNHTCWGKVLIKKGASVGLGSIILPGVTIGENALIGAGSVVSRDVPAGEKWFGVPAHAHGKRFE